jgi:hypothetical protein
LSWRRATACLHHPPTPTRSPPCRALRFARTWPALSRRASPCGLALPPAVLGAGQQGGTATVTALRPRPYGHGPTVTALRPRPHGHGPITPPAQTPSAVAWSRPTTQTLSPTPTRNPGITLTRVSGVPGAAFASLCLGGAFAPGFALRARGCRACLGAGLARTLGESPNGTIYVGEPNAMRGTALGRRVVVGSRGEPSRRGARREHVRRVRFSDGPGVPTRKPSATGTHTRTGAISLP